MYPILTIDQLQSLEQGHGKPVPVVDAGSGKVYFLVSEDQMNSIQAIIEDGEFTPAELYPLIAKCAAAAGWDSPEMQEYDHYDEHRR